MSNDRELKIVIKADGSVAVNEIKLVGQSTDELEKQLKEAKQELSKLQAELKNVGVKAKETDGSIQNLNKDTAELRYQNKMLALALTVTQGELSKAGKQINSLEGQLKSLGSTSSGSADKLEKNAKALSGIAKFSQDVAGKIKLLKNSWTEYSVGLNQTLEVLGKLKQYAQFTWDFLLDGAILGETKAAFQDYAQSVGRSGDEIVSKLKIASAGTIDEFNLIKTASLAMSLGVTKDADKMANLLEIAKNKARLFGVSTKQAFDDIVTGIGRASPKILDNLGIRIPAGFEKMTDGMSDADKVAKLFELTLDEGNKQLEAMGGVTYSGADSFRELEASWANLKRAGGELISNVLVPLNVALAKTLNLATAAIEAANDLYTLAAEKGIHGAGSPFRDITDAQLLEMYSGYREDYANALSVGNSVASPANSFARSETCLDDASRLRAEQNLKAAEQNLLAVEKEMTRRSKMMLSYAEQTVDDVKIVFGDLYDSWLPGYAGKASKEWLRQQERLKRESDRLVRETKSNFETLTDAAAKDLDLLGDAFDDFGDDADKLIEGFDDVTESANEMVDSFENAESELRRFNAEISELARNKNALEEALSTLKDLSMLTDIGNLNFNGVAKKLDPFNLANQSYAASVTAGMANYFSGGLLATDYSLKYIDVNKKEKESLSKIVADGIQAGFNNTDWSNIGLTIGNMLTNVLSRSVLAENPVFSASGAVNWGNLGINLGVSAISSYLTRPGRFFGGTEVHGAENVDAANSIASRLLESRESLRDALINPFLQGMQREINQTLVDAMQARVGYTVSSSGNGITSDRTKTYSLADWGAIDSLAATQKVLENSGIFGAKYEYDLGRIRASDPEKYFDELLANYADAIFSAEGIKTLSAEDAKKYYGLLSDRDALQAEQKNFQLGQRQSGFDFAMNFGAYLGQNYQALGLPSTDGRTTSLAFADWTDPSALVEMYARDADMGGNQDLIKQALFPALKGSSEELFNLQAMQISGDPEYLDNYLAYVDRNIVAFEDLMVAEQERIESGTLSLEEQLQALDNYQRVSEAYHNAQLDKLRLEKQQQEEEKRMMAEQSMAKIEAGLSLVGELNQRGDKVLIIQGGDVQEAIDEMMIQFADNPEMIAILQKAKKTADAKALWG